MPFSTTFTPSNTSAALKSMWPDMTPPLQSTTPVISWGGWHHRKFGSLWVFFGYPQKEIKRGWYPWNNETLTHPLLPFVHQFTRLEFSNSAFQCSVLFIAPIICPLAWLGVCTTWAGGIQLGTRFLDGRHPILGRHGMWAVENSNVHISKCGWATYSPGDAHGSCEVEGPLSRSHYTNQCTFPTARWKLDEIGACLE